MTIPDNQKDEIKARIDLAELFASYGHEVKQNGSGLWCRCPFHTEKTPSCKIDPVSGYYHCFGCGKSGDAIGFVMEVEGSELDTTIRIFDVNKTKVDKNNLEDMLKEELFQF